MGSKPSDGEPRRVELDLARVGVELGGARPPRSTVGSGSPRITPSCCSTSQSRPAVCEPRLGVLDAVLPREELRQPEPACRAPGRSTSPAWCRTSAAPPAAARPRTARGRTARAARRSARGRWPRAAPRRTSRRSRPGSTSTVTRKSSSWMALYVLLRIRQRGRQVGAVDHPALDRRVPRTPGIVASQSPGPAPRRRAGSRSAAGRSAACSSCGR